MLRQMKRSSSLAPLLRMSPTCGRQVGQVRLESFAFCLFLHSLQERNVLNSLPHPDTQSSTSLGFHISQQETKEKFRDRMIQNRQICGNSEHLQKHRSLWKKTTTMTSQQAKYPPPKKRMRPKLFHGSKQKNSSKFTNKTQTSVGDIQKKF